ncbi:POS9-activating factor FAP7 [Uncinocarpus reesii 1704]|uniref:Adenylate kinase isoenzyme 6 homolog n=1 Tax=Uncinocarpus reesii (strain UAMH 1704) TaxID=336963 RepID=C4JMH9_UNCRE|nr:POS9-activating factor FAP7 [Uncinocarpus reesii 1704]EEP79191.1 POS9-activating factor FAP7 [Uncinocarpus reesii 1704]
MRTSPNIIITGTPGVGKTVHCEQLAQETGLKHLSINTVAKERGCHDGYDEKLKSWIVDEDKVPIFSFPYYYLLDEIENEVAQGGYLIDWHACDLFPKSWIDLVVVLRCPSTSILYDRLASRGYGEDKLQENLDAEIFEVLLDEARQAYDEEIVVELMSENDDEIESNCSRIVSWIDAWQQNRTTTDG